MTVERHLFLQELTLLPSAEWNPRSQGWLIARVADGTGYWLQPGSEARQLNAGDGLIFLREAGGTVRASQLGPLKLQFFTVCPASLSGLLTVTEWHQLEIAPRHPSPPTVLFSASAPLGREFMRLTDPASLPSDTPRLSSHRRDLGAPTAGRLATRCALLQLWAGAVGGWLATPAFAGRHGNRLRDHFRELVGQMTEAELSECSLADLAGHLHCSGRHFSRLFRKEFGVPFRARQLELRLQRARQLLAATHAKIVTVAYDCGYRHLRLFNAMFKKRFGLTPGEWRQQQQIEGTGNNEAKRRRVKPQSG